MDLSYLLATVAGGLSAFTVVGLGAWVTGIAVAAHKEHHKYDIDSQSGAWWSAEERV